MGLKMVIITGNVFGGASTTEMKHFWCYIERSTGDMLLKSLLSHFIFNFLSFTPIHISCQIAVDRIWLVPPS